MPCGAVKPDRRGQDGAGAGRSQRGKFIVFEGGEGCGKSTQSRHLIAALQGQGLEVLATREPGGTPHGERVRALLKAPDLRWPVEAELWLHQAARVVHVQDVIVPHLRRGGWVVCDRYTDSTLAYQGGGYGLDRAWLEQLNGVASGGLVPDLTIVLAVPVRQGLGRVLTRAQIDWLANEGGGKGEVAENPDQYEAETAEFHTRVRDTYLELAAAAPERYLVVKSRGSATRIAASVWERVRKHPALRGRL